MISVDTLTIDPLALIALVIGASALMLLVGAGIGHYSAVRSETRRISRGAYMEPGQMRDMAERLDEDAANTLDEGQARDLHRAHLILHDYADLIEGTKR